MKKILFAFCMLFVIANVTAQEVEYKKGIISVDGNEYAKVEVKKENFGLTKNFEVFSMSGKKLIIAAPQTLLQQ